MLNYADIFWPYITYQHVSVSVTFHPKWFLWEHLASPTTQGVPFVLSAKMLKAIALRLEAIALKLEAIASMLKAIAIRLEGWTQKHRRVWTPKMFRVFCPTFLGHPNPFVPKLGAQVGAHWWPLSCTRSFPTNLKYQLLATKNTIKHRCKTKR